MDIFVHGYSVKLPGCKSNKDFFETLKNAADMTTDKTRYPAKYLQLPPRQGVISETDRFDNMFFKFSENQSNTLDPAIRMLFEVSYEALMDSHVSIDSLRGSRDVGVYVGHCYSDAGTYHLQYGVEKNGTEIVNTSNSMAANKLSFFYDLKGPSYTIDTACSSSLVALNNACKDIEAGVITSAIVAGLSLTTDPNKNASFNAYKMLSPDGRCFSFDERANGYCRSDGIVCLYISKQKTNSIARIIGTGTNNDGYKKEGITFPSGLNQAMLSEQVIKKYGICKNDITFIECHGTGTIAGDHAELDGLYSVYQGCEKTINIGSVKSNMGHCEGCSGLVSVVKSLLMLENDVCLPNFDFRSTKHSVLLDGTFKVCDRFIDNNKHGIIHVNNFGFGGTNAVCFLSKNEHDHPHQDYSTLSQYAVKGFGNHENKIECYEWSSSQINIGNHIGFSYMMDKNDRIHKSKHTNNVSTVAWVLPGQGCHYVDMGKQLFEHNKVFRETIIRLDKYYPGLVSFYADGDKWFSDNNSVVGIVSFQVATINVLKSEKLHFDYIIGHSIGEIACAYASEYIDESMAMKIACVRKDFVSILDPLKCIIDKGNERRFEHADYLLQEGETKWSFNGRMVAVGMIADEIQSILDEASLNQTVIACYNSTSGQTVSGPAEEIDKMIAEIYKRYPDCFIKTIETNRIAYHSKLFGYYEQFLYDEFHKQLGYIQPQALARGWLSTCETNIHDISYHVNNIIRPVYFKQQIEKLPPNTLILEIGPSSPMLSQIKRIRTDVVLCPFAESGKSNVENFEQPSFVYNLYGKNTHSPTSVSKHTINDYSSLWNHSSSFKTPTWEDYQVSTKPGTEIVFDLKHEWKTLVDHVVNGSNLFPAMGYVYIMWKSLGGLPVQFQHYNIHEALIINETKLVFTVHVDEQSIKVYYKDVCKVSANYVRLTPGMCQSFVSPSMAKTVSASSTTSSSQFYSWIRRIGYSYGDSYRLLDNVSMIGADMKETTDWIAHMDACLHLLLQNQTYLAFPMGIEKMDILCNLAESTPSSKLYLQDGSLYTDQLSIKNVKMQPSIFNYKHDAFVRKQVWVPIHSVVDTETINEILRFQCRTYYSNISNCVLSHLKTTDSMQDADVIISNIENVYEHAKPQFIVSTRNIKMEGYTDPIFTWIISSECEQLYVYSKLRNNVEMVKSWKQIDTQTVNPVCIVGNGAVSFRKTFVKEHPECTHVWASDVDSNIIMPITQHDSEGIPGIWIEKKANNEQTVENNEPGGGYFLMFTKPGVLDSAKWIHEPQLKSHTISYAALNFRDVMRAFGKLKEVDMNVGFEFSGINHYTKQRVFGVGKRCIATHCSPAYTYPTPQFLTDAEAATIPVVYLTAYYAHFEKAKLQSGDTVLIHAGTGGVGQAAIRICKSRGIHVITTCHESKRTWLKDHFQLNDDQIGDSRSDHFISTVMNKTNGKGVTCVLNSLSGELQIASLKCIAEGGSFCEIGKYDIMQNTPIGQALFEKNISFFVIDLMPLLHDPRFFTMWDSFLTTGFMNNEIQPLPFTEYHQSDIIQAFRDMSQAKHKGKIVIRFDESNRFQHIFKNIDVYGQHHMITGGLGGLALCLAVRLSERGLSELTLISRSGEPCTQWQKDRFKQIEQNGTRISLVKGDVSLCSSYDTDAHFNVIWHAATVYDDTMFKNMTDQTWDPVQHVKVTGYNVLRTTYPSSRIVNFSSVVSYLGNPGQTNYAWANGELDNASYNNTKNTTTLQFGAIDNVGFVGKSDKNSKILQNAASLQLVRIDEILDFIEEYGLDTSSPVFSFYSITEKNKKTNIDLKKWSLHDSASIISNVLGGTIDSFLNSSNIPLNDLGMDSLSRVELANQINDMGPSKPISPAIIGSCTLQSLTEMITK